MSYIVNEREGIVRFVVVKRTPSAHDVTVRISTEDGSAKSGILYDPHTKESHEENVALYKRMLRYTRAMSTKLNCFLIVCIFYS